MTHVPDHDPLADLPWPKPVEPSAEVSQKIRYVCTKNLCAKRGMSAGMRLGVSLALSLGVGVTLYILGRSFGRTGPVLRSALYGAAGWGLVMTAVLLVGLGRPAGTRASSSVRLALAVAVPVAFLLYLSLSASSWASFSDFTHGARAEHAVGCGLFALLVGALGSGGILLLWRGTDPLTPRLSGALAGLAGGLGSAIAMGVACPSHEAWHLCVSHGLMVVTLGVVGWGVGRRLLAP